MAGSLFQGSPQTATSYTTSNTETPKWLQDAIYNQIQMATNVANTPYQEYMGDRVAELSPLQQQAYQQVIDNQGAWKDQMGTVASGLQNIASGPGGAAAASKYFTDAAGMSGVTAAQPYIDTASGNINKAAGIDTATGLQATQNTYLQPNLAASDLAAGQLAYGQASQAAGNIAGSANPYLQAAAQKATTGIADYMNPYQQNAMDVIAKQGARNLSENLLPGVSDAFIKAGQFGGTRMGEFGSRALRDTQEAVLNQQAQMANQGYGQALTASTTDLARQAQLGSTAGSLTAQQANALSSIGQGQTTAGQAQQNFGLTAAQQAQQAQTSDAARMLQAGQASGQLGQTMGSLTQGQQSALTNIGTQTGALTNADLTRQQGALTALANTTQQQNAMRSGDVASLEAAGQGQQIQKQKQLDAAYAQAMEPINYPKQQLDWLSTQVRGMAPIAPTSTTQSGQTTGATYSASPLSQVASGMAMYKAIA